MAARLPAALYPLIERAWHALPIPLRDRLLHVTQMTFTIGVSVVILDAGDRVLLLRHRFRYSSVWQLPGGFIRKGEDFEAAAEREIREETGYIIRIGVLLAANVTRPGHADIVYLARVTGGKKCIDSGEILDARFFPPHALPEGMVEDQANSILRALDLVSRSDNPRL